MQTGYVTVKVKAISLYCVVATFLSVCYLLIAHADGRCYRQGKGYTISLYCVVATLRQALASLFPTAGMLTNPPRIKPRGISLWAYARKESSMSTPTEAFYIEELDTWVILDENDEPIRRATLGYIGAGWSFDLFEVKEVFSR
ncbi:MAG: hypothetical protein EBX40_07095 [Gammaproteobacteria bacterium]|nr:hypothetical protein [Gammaproteobacteria bacterium]